MKKIGVYFIGGTGTGIIRHGDGLLHPPRPEELEENNAAIAAYFESCLAGSDVRAAIIPCPEVPFDMLGSDHHFPDWNRLALSIARHNSEYDGFVVIAGRDTMTMAAAYLSYALGAIARPVIVTTSGRCFHVQDTSTPLDCVAIAANTPIREVCAYDGATLLRGTDAVLNRVGGGRPELESFCGRPLGHLRGGQLALTGKPRTPPSGQLSVLGMDRIPSVPIVCITPGIDMIKYYFEMAAADRVCLQGLVVQPPGFCPETLAFLSTNESLRRLRDLGIPVVVAGIPGGLENGLDKHHVCVPLHPHVARIKLSLLMSATNPRTRGVASAALALMNTDLVGEFADTPRYRRLLDSAPVTAEVLASYSVA